MEHPEFKCASTEKLLKAADFEAWLDVDVNTVYGYVQKGLIPYIKIQSNVRFRREEIIDWLETHSYRPRKGRKKTQ
jgi:predicted DNA-binding transcriptional regulator AlpA